MAGSHPKRARRVVVAALAAVAVAAAIGVWLVHRGYVVVHEPAAAKPVPNTAFRSPRDPQAPATVWAVGDGANGNAGSRSVAQLMHQGSPARILYLGDVYQSGTAKEFRKNFADVYGSEQKLMLPTPGNHDWPNHPTGYDPFWEQVTGQPTPPWYALTIGGWRLIALNSETPTDARQLAWLRGQLAHTPGTCVLPFMHRPRYNAGQHGDATDLEPIWQLLRGHAPLALAGHDHDMQRLHPIQGVTQYVSGAGGRSHYQVDASDPRLAFSNDQDYGALLIKLAPGSAQLTFISADGRALDRSAVRCLPSAGA